MLKISILIFAAHTEASKKSVRFNNINMLTMQLCFYQVGDISFQQGMLFAP